MIYMHELTGTPLFHRTLAFDHGDAERNALMREVWAGTPWMVDAFTDRINSDTWFDVMEWCREQFGPEASPINGRSGAWHIGAATINGWTWIGFDTEDKMRRFMERWPRATTDKV